MGSMSNPGKGLRERLLILKSMVTIQINKFSLPQHHRTDQLNFDSFD